MAEKHSIRNGVIVTVVGGLILAAVQAWAPSWLRGALAAGKVAWTCVTWKATVPLWVAGLALLITFFVGRATARGAAAEPLASTPPVGDAPIDQLSDLQPRILVLLAHGDGRAFHPNEFIRLLGSTNLRVSSALDSLAERGRAVAACGQDKHRCRGNKA